MLAAVTSHLAVITDGATLYCHAQQPAAIALTDLHFKVLLPAVIAISVAALHSGGSGNRDITETATTLYLSSYWDCMTMSATSASRRSGWPHEATKVRHEMASHKGQISTGKPCER